LLTVTSNAIAAIPDRWQYPWNLLYRRLIEGRIVIERTRATWKVGSYTNRYVEVAANSLCFKDRETRCGCPNVVEIFTTLPDILPRANLFRWPAKTVIEQENPIYQVQSGCCLVKFAHAPAGRPSGIGACRARSLDQRGLLR